MGSLKLRDKQNLLRVYPNPAKDILHVETNGSATFSLIDQSGKILVSTNINGKGVINVSSIAAGLYYLKNNIDKNLTGDVDQLLWMVIKKPPRLVATKIAEI